MISGNSKSKFFKGSRRISQRILRQPLFYLFGVLFVCLLGILFFNSGATSKSPELGDFSFLTANITTKFSAQDLFVRPPKNFLRESPEMLFLQENSLVGVSPPATINLQVLGGLWGAVEPEARKEIIEYIVESGDTLSFVAEKFELSLQSVLWANDLSDRSIIKPGQKLIIPPVSGIIYHIKKGDTLSEIAKMYKGEVKEIIAFNELSDEGDIYIGDILVIPNGKMPSRPKQTYYNVQVPLGSSYFICPHSACLITQGLHWYNAIDFGGKCGDPIYAAAGGTVQKVKYGWHKGAGNYLTVLHPNGVVTGYGHISKSLVVPGQKVSQGDIIALMGGKPGAPGSGISTGCHVHFSVHGARNLFAK